MPVGSKYARDIKFRPCRSCPIFVIIAQAWFMSEVAWCQNNAGCSASIETCVKAQTARWVNIETLKCFCIPCAKKTFKLPTACLFCYNLLPQGSDSMGESSCINLQFSNVSGAALTQKVAPANWYQCMSVVISVDDSLCHGALNDTNSQPRERP